MNRQMLRTVAGGWMVSLCLVGGAWAYTNFYTSISVPGQLTDAGDWKPEFNLLSLTGDRTWSGTLQVSNPGGLFKFAADKDWAVNWGGASPAVRLPARGVGPMWQGGADMGLPAGTAEGAYVFTFHEDTATYDVEPAVAVAPAVESARLVGSFNSEGADAGGEFTGSGDTWTATDVAMSAGSTFRLLVNGTESWGRLGGSENVTMAQLGAGVTPCGEDAWTLVAERGGKFTFTMDFRNNVLTAAQTETNGTEVASVRAYGDFVMGGASVPGPNLEEGNGVWSGTFLVTNNTFLMGIAGFNAGGEQVKRWGAPPTPLSGSTNVTLTAYETASMTANRVKVTAKAGAYTLRFNPTSGSLALTWSGLQNLFKNPSFERGNEVWADDWGLYRAEATAEGDAHSGVRAVRLYRRYDEEPNLGNIDQWIDLPSSAGRTLRVTGNFRAEGGWNGEKVRIIVEWVADGTVISSAEKEVLNLEDAWQEETLEATVPQDGVQAHVLFKYDGGVLGEALLVDDVQAYLAGGRSENFDTWGEQDSFARLDYGWQASSAKTVKNEDLRPKADGGLVISKYIEGGNNDKAIELYNGTTNAIDLSKYQLHEYDNGAKSATRKMKLSGTLAPKACAIVTREDRGPNPPDAALQAGLTIRTNALRFNGDDVVVLSKGSATFVDRVGQVDTNASRTFWAKTMRDHTLVRKASVTNGTSGAVARDFDLGQWEVLAKGDFGDVGRHSFDDGGGAYWPEGLALCMAANSTLTLGGISAGGVGDVDFWYRAWEGGTTLVAEMASDETSGDWTEIWRAEVAGTATNYAHAQFTASGAGKGAFRLRTEGGAALVDEINVGEALSIKRIEHFTDWDICTPSDLYMRNQWKVQGQVNTNGDARSMAAVLSAEGEYVQSPFFPDGVGTVRFKAGSVTPNVEGTLALAVSTDGGATWTTNNAHVWKIQTPPKGTNVTCELSFMSPSAVRLVWTGGGTLYVDDVNVGVPAEPSRTLTFDTLSPTTAYNSYSVGGWTVTKTSVYTGGANGNYGVLDGATNHESSIRSPRLEELTDISFQFKYWSDKTTKVRFKIEVSANGSQWTTVTTNAGTGGSVNAWTLYTTNLPTNQYHYVRISPTLKDKICIDEIGLKKASEPPGVALSAWLDPWPVEKEPFQVAASAYPRNGAVIQEVRAVYSIGGKGSTNVMTAAGGGEYRSGQLTASNAQKVTYFVECVYTGAGIGIQTNRTAMEELTVSKVRPGDVWINEVVYEAVASDGDVWAWDVEQNHEFIELCGKAGTSIGNWKVELGFVMASDIALISNVIYATYTIPAEATLKDAGNGFGFYVIGDKELKEAGEKVDLVLTNFVPKAMSAAERNHINDGTGVIRLKKGKLVIQSLSYGKYESESEYISAVQDGTSDNSVSLSGEGGNPDAFDWGNAAAMTIGAVNEGQTLVSAGEKEPVPVWYDPSFQATTRSVGSFTLFDPLRAANVEAVTIHFAYDTTNFSNARYLTGKLYHRAKGASQWKDVERNHDTLWNSVTDSEGHGFVAFTAISERTYDRLQTMEYVIEVGPTGPIATNYANVWLGTDSTGATIAYDSFEAAAKSPFEHTFTIAQRIEITDFERDAESGVLKLWTTGNDEWDRFEHFAVQWSGSMMAGDEEWQNLQILTHQGEAETPYDYFEVVPPTNGTHFIRVQPVP